MGDLRSAVYAAVRSSPALDGISIIRLTDADIVASLTNFVTVRTEPDAAMRSAGSGGQEYGDGSEFCNREAGGWPISSSRLAYMGGEPMEEHQALWYQPSLFGNDLRAVCSVPHCSKPRRSANVLWCDAHYMRMYRTGQVQGSLAADEWGKTCQVCGNPLPIGLETGQKPRKYCGPVCRQMSYTARRYGISGARYMELFNEGGGCCWICQRELRLSQGIGQRNGNRSGYRRDAASLDHNHTTGEVRGILCQWCNTAIGHLDDDPERAEASARYLRRFS